MRYTAVEKIKKGKANGRAREFYFEIVKRLTRKPKLRASPVASVEKQRLPYLHSNINRCPSPFNEKKNRGALIDRPQ